MIAPVHVHCFSITKSSSDYNLPEIICFSDASSIASGAYSVNFKDHICHAFWSNEDAQKSFTFREIKAVSIALVLRSHSEQ